MTSEWTRLTPRAKERLRRHGGHYLLLVPMLVLYLGFTLWPMAASWWYAFFDWDGIGAPTDWVGTANFVEALTSGLFWNSFWHSFQFSLAAILIEMPLALMLALVLNNRRLYGRVAYRLMLFLPTVSTTAIVGIVFAIILDPSGGSVNSFLMALGLDQPIEFLGSEALALPTVMAVAVWKGMGVTLIYWLAALQTIPADLLEASAVDGVSRRQRLRHVTLPVMAPMAVVILMLTFQTSLNPFDLVQAMTEGGPNYATDVNATYIYRNAFDPVEMAPRFGYACAAGAVFGVFTLLLTVPQFPALRRQYAKTSTT